jgi:hypothetical protein
MSKKARIIDLSPSEAEEARELLLDSGRRVSIRSGDKEDVLEVEESTGEVVVKVRLTDSGPVISLEGARLELTALDTISLKARRVEIAAEEEAAVKSEGALDIGSKDDMDIRAEGEVRVKGKLIHLN